MTTDIKLDDRTADLLKAAIDALQAMKEDREYETGNDECDEEKALRAAIAKFKTVPYRIWP